MRERSYADSIHLLRVDRGLERSGDWEWDNDRYPEYRTIESRNGYYSPSEGHAELWDRIKPLHFESIGKAANQTTMDPRTPNGHTPEILNYVRKELDVCCQVHAHRSLILP